MPLMDILVINPKPNDKIKGSRNIGEIFAAESSRMKQVGGDNCFGVRFEISKEDLDQVREIVGKKGYVLQGPIDKGRTPIKPLSIGPSF